MVTMSRILVAALVLVAMTACTTVVVSPPSAQDAPGEPRALEDAGVDVAPNDATWPDVAQPDAAVVDASAEAALGDSGAPDAQPAPCARAPGFDALCKGYSWGRAYAWACGSWFPVLPACKGAACNCQGTQVGNPDGGPDYLCCDVP